ncbi:MAG: ATP-binding protein [Nannocystaceae bacterium]
MSRVPDPDRTLALAGALDVLPELVGILDADGRLVHRNAAWSASLHPWAGTGTAAAYGDGLPAIAGADRGGFTQALARILADADAPPWRCEYSLGEGGARTTWQSSVRRLAGGAVVVHEDITHPRTTEAAFKRSQARLRTILTGAPLVLFSLDRSGVFTLVEGMGAAAGGFVGPDQIGTTVWASYAHVPALLELVKGALEGRIGVTTVHVGRLAYEVRCSPLLGHDDAIEGAVGVATDVSERIRVQQLKDEFLSIVSHELRTPLTSIRGSLGLLEGGVTGALSERALELVKVARINSDRLVRLVSDMLDLDRIEAGLLQLQRQPVSLGEVVVAAVREMGGLAEHAGVRLQTAIEGDALELVGDRDRLVQVATNLLSNAIKFSPASAVVQAVVRRRDGFARVEIVDRGPGIAPEDLPRLFQKFSQLDASDRRARGGSGLGLVICKRVIEASGGRIGVDSTFGRGSTFWFELPLPRAQASAGAAQPAEREHTVAIDLAALDRARRSGGDPLAELLRLLGEIEAGGLALLADAHAAASLAAAVPHHGVALREALRACLLAIDGALAGPSTAHAEVAAAQRRAIVDAMGSPS